MTKRLLSLLLIIVLMATMLMGCGDNNGNNETTAGTEAANSTEATTKGNEKVEISFYTTETGKDDMFQSLINDFQAKNEGITVEYIAAGNDQLQKWMSLYASNEGPTVSLMDPINIFENQARLLEFTADNAPFLTNIDENALSTLTFDGKVYAAPMSAAGIGILYNKAVCDAAVGGEFDPASIKTVSDLKDLFEKIEATGVSATMLTGVNWSLGSHFLGQTYGAAIGNVDERVAYVASLKEGKVSLATDKVFNEYMDTFDLLAKYNYNKADPLVGNINLDAEALATGKVGTWFMGDWAWTYLAPIVTADQSFGLLPVPRNDDASDVINQSIATSYAKAYCVDASQNSEAQQAAGLKFIEYLTSDKDAQAVLAKVTGQAYPYKNFTEKIESPLGRSTAQYIEKGLTYDFYGTSNLLPSDIWYECGAFMCEYLAGASTREKLAESIEGYWKKTK
ncbi:ABC transporter substrate-binding protein [Fusibacter bizertensis]